MEPSFRGKCLCGALSFTALGKPVVIAQCHCEECRRQTGGGHSVGAMFAAKNVTLSGALGAYSYTAHSGATVTRKFCPNCGSSVYGTNTGTPDHLTLSLGLFDDAKDLRIEVVVFERDRPHWDGLDERVMRFDTQPDWSPPS